MANSEMFNRISEAANKGDADSIKIALEELEDGLLLSSKFSDADMDLISQVLLSPEILFTNGIELLFIIAYTDREKMTDSQLARFFRDASLAFGKGMSEKVALVLADFAARILPHDVAFELFKDVLKKPLSSNELKGLLVGLDLIKSQRRRSGISTNEVDELFVQANRRTS